MESNPAGTSISCEYMCSTPTVFLHIGRNFARMPEEFVDLSATITVPVRDKKLDFAPQSMGWYLGTILCRFGRMIKEWERENALRNEPEIMMHQTREGDSKGEIVTDVSVQEISNLIIELPGRPPAMLAQDLAKVYETETRRINQAVKRNLERFPEDFCFQATDNEAKVLISQSVMSKKSRIANPYLFTREGANQLSAVLHTETAIQRSIQIMRAFSAMEEKAAPALPEKYARQLLQAENELKKARAEAERLALENRENESKLEGYRRFLDATGLYPLTAALKMLRVQPHLHMRKLREKKVLYYLNGRNMPAEKYLRKGYFEVKSQRGKAQTFVTGKGLEWLRGIF